MQYSGKPPRSNGKIKNHNQITPSYNGGLHFLSQPNVSNSGQLQINRKYINNMGNINEVSVLQYHRTTNMQIKNNNLEMNRFQNLRHQQQAFMYKNPQYHNNRMNPNNMPQKFSGNFPIHRTNLNDQVRATAPLTQPHANVEYLSKRSKDLRNPHNTNNLNNKSKYMQTSPKKQPTQVINKNHEQSNSLEEQEAAKGHTNLIRHKQVPDIVNKVINNVDDKENNNSRTDIEQNIEKLLNSSNEQSSTEDHQDNISNKSTKPTREKTPMCLINDLARFNKISFQYRLTSENGPAHCKRFTVTLMLGDEEYTAEGLKIKEAQHLAAKEAIEKTKYKHPTPKVNRRTDDDIKPNITPTVELNALAMKLGQQTYYIIDHQQIESNSNYKSMNHHQPFDTNHALALQQPPTGAVENVLNNQRRQNLPRYQQNRFLPFQHMQQNGPVPSAYTFYSPACPSKITLIVGTKQFVGVGRTLQLAKHDAASNALKVLKEQIEKEQLETQNESLLEENENKSPISLVFEIGIKRNLTVDFKVLREEGPAHMRTFVTACIVGDIVTEGEGTGKKISKKKAAHKMLEELKKLPPLSPVASPVKRTKLKASSKKSCDQSKDVNNTAEHKDVEKPLSQRSKNFNAETEDSNPINKLIEWHQNKKEKEPEFKLINELGQENSRRKQFIMEISSNNIVVRGVGINKRLAKQDAAQKFLNAVTGTAEQTTAINGNESTLKQSSIGKKNQTDTTNKTANSRKFAKQDAAKKLIIKETDRKKLCSAKEENEDLKESSNDKEIQNSTMKECNNLHINKAPCLPQETNETSATLSTAISSAVTTSKESSVTTSSSKSQNLHMKDQLMYLAKLLGFEVEFSDYPKGNHNEFLTIVMLSTTPPQICHGVGVDANESQEDAAKNALKILSEMGLNNAVKS